MNLCRFFSHRLHRNVRRFVSTYRPLFYSKNLSISKQIYKEGAFDVRVGNLFLQCCPFYLMKTIGSKPNNH